MASGSPVEQAPTPSPSLARSTETPVADYAEIARESKLAEARERRAFEPSRTFKTQQTNDRKAATTAIRNVVRSLQLNGIWAETTIQNRRNIIFKEYQRKMDSRGKHKKQGSTKTWFPEYHDEAAELRWLLSEFRDVIQESGKKKEGRIGKKPVSYQESSNDEDDEEVPIKTESREDEGEESEDGGSESESESDSGSGSGSVSESTECESEADETQHLKHDIRARRPVPGATKKRSASIGNDEQVKKRVVYTAISRGMAIGESSAPKRARSVGWPWFKVAGA